jgi:hypothetical protein
MYSTVVCSAGPATAGVARRVSAATSGKSFIEITSAFSAARVKYGS